MRIEAEPAVLALWWTALGLTVVAVVPLAVWLLHRALRAAREIRRATAETLAAAGGIARHTADVRALDATAEAAGPLLERTAAVRAAAAELEELLRSRVP